MYADFKLKATLLVCLQLVASSYGDNIIKQLKGSDKTLNAAEIIRTRGFIAEWYPVISYDGTPLSIYHVINPLADPRTLNLYPVLVMHGFTGDATQMLAHSHNVKPRKPSIGVPTVEPNDETLAFALANNNFDVWLMDFRGANLHNPVMREHYKKLGSKFWNFTVDDQLFNDVPAAINFVLQQTQAPMLTYVGYSESTLYMFGLLSTFPDLADKIAAFIALAPVTWVQGAKGVLIPLALPYLLIPDDFNGDFSPTAVQQTVSNLFDTTCRSPIIRNTICLGYTNAIGGVGTSDDQADFYGALFKASSIKSVKQVAQLFVQKRFGMYDYGPIGNMRQYGTLKAPDYDVSKIRLNRIIMVRAGKDFLSDPEDQEILLSKMGVKPYRDIKIPEYNHWDFLMGKNLSEKISKPVMAALHEILTSLGNGYITIRQAEPIKIAQPGAIFTPEISEAGGRIESQNNPSNVPFSNPTTGDIRPVHSVIEGIGETINSVGEGLVSTTKQLAHALPNPISSLTQS